MDELVKNTILVVDDENLNRVMLARILGEKYDIFTANDGASALQKAAELKPDLIMLDIVMPGMDGYEVLSQLKKQDSTRTIPVIFITGLASPEEEEKALSLNAIDYINKPFRPNIVKLRVSNQIRNVNQIRTIERLSMIDQLTEIANRRSFDNHLNLEWRRAIREKTHLSLLMLDVDKFKDYNDTYGHQQGDVILRAVAKEIERSMWRPADFAARWGGEEFAALLANTDILGAMEVAERIRENIENLHIANIDYSDTAPITISIGAASLSPSADMSLDLFISAADNALYEAKRGGRNMVCRAK